MVAGWVWVDGRELVGKWFAGCVGNVRGLVGPTNTNTNTTHRPATFQCEVMRVSANPCNLGVWVTKKRKEKNGVTNKYVQGCFAGGRVRDAVEAGNEKTLQKQIAMPRAPYKYPINPGRLETPILTTDCVYISRRDLNHECGNA